MIKFRRQLPDSLCSLRLVGVDDPEWKAVAEVEEYGTLRGDATIEWYNKQKKQKNTWCFIRPFWSKKFDDLCDDFILRHPPGKLLYKMVHVFQLIYEGSTACGPGYHSAFNLGGRGHGFTFLANGARV